MSLKLGQSMHPGNGGRFEKGGDRGVSTGWRELKERVPLGPGGADGARRVSKDCMGRGRRKRKVARGEVREEGVRDATRFDSQSTLHHIFTFQIEGHLPDIIRLTISYA